VALGSFVVLSLHSESESCPPPPAPTQNAFFRKWDIVVVVAVLFTATVTPFEVAFLKTSLNGLFVVNRLVDVVFLTVRHGTKTSHWHWHLLSRCCHGQILQVGGPCAVLRHQGVDLHVDCCHLP
jgi:hypothetical protein